jgi:hypothetical protein
VPWNFSHVFCLFFVFSVLRLNSGSMSWATPPAQVFEYFWGRVSWTICSSWLWTLMLLISASWVARITGVTHRCPAIFWCCCLFCFVSINFS